MKLLALSAFCWLAMHSSAVAQTITSPTTAKGVAPWTEYATRELRDPWDMKERTDLGWYTWGIDLPTSNMTGKQMTIDGFGHTIFTGVPTSTDASIFLLDSNSLRASPIGKLGSNYPIDTAAFPRLLVSMRFGNEIKPPMFGQLGTVPVMQVYWSRDTIYFDAVTRPLGGTYLTVDGAGNQVGIPFATLSAEPFGTMEGGHYVIYSLPIGSLAALQALNPNIVKWKNIAANNPAVDINWGSAGLFADSLRFKPVNLSGSASGAVDIDWVRLVSPAADPPETVSWTGGGTFDIVVSTATDCGASNGNYAVLAYSKTSGYQFNPQMLPNGTYFVGLRDRVTANGADTPASRQIRACSASVNGSYTVVDYPTFSFSSPNPAGSADDFATVFLNNAWDFTSGSDIDLANNISAFWFSTEAAERIDGSSMGNVPLLFGTSTPGTPATGGVGDPYIYPLFWSVRGMNNRIDTTRYRLFNADLGIDHERDLVNGSILRLVWHIAGETFTFNGGTFDAENVTTDIPLRHMRKGASTVDAQSARYVIDRVQLDLGDRFFLPLEAAANGSPSRTGWFNNPAQCAVAGCNQQRLQPFNRVGVDNFRIDFHEFTPPTNFYIRQATLTAHERATAGFVIAWTSTLAPVPPTGAYADPTQWKVRLYAVRTKPETSPGAGNASPSTPVTRVCSSNPGVDTFLITPGGAEPALATGVYPWNPALTAGLVEGGLYFVCAGIIAPGQSTPAVFNLSKWPVIAAASASPLPTPRLLLDRSTIWLSAKHTGSVTPPNLSARTPPQTVRLTQAGGSQPVVWLIDACSNYDPASPAPCTGTVDFLQFSTTSGSGSAVFTIGLKDSSQLPHSTTGLNPVGVVVRVREANGGTTANSPQYIQVFITIHGVAEATAAPLGQVDTPAQGANGVQGTVGMTGWVVDDIGVQSVRIYRNCLSASEPASCLTGVLPSSPSTPLTYLGDATFLAGARSDVEASFPTLPQSNAAGWGYAILTNMLPRTVGPFAPFGGQGPITLYAVAYDYDGHAQLLGRVWNTDQTPTFVSLDNDAIAVPFGVIDTPIQGGPASGASYANFGWAITPDNGSGIQIDPNASTMWAFVDGIPLGHPAYNHCRGTVGTPPPAGVFCNDDVSNIFGNVTPQPPLQPRGSNPSRFRNLDSGRGPIGVFVFDTTVLGNGLHTIEWSVTDSAGRVQGIGSRLFNITNGVPSGGRPLALDTGRAVSDLDVLERVTPAVGVRTGLDLTQRFALAPVVSGTATVSILPMQRVELALPNTISGSTWRGYSVRQGRLEDLPVGSAIAGDDRFVWQPAVVHFGAYDLLFVRENKGGTRDVLPVRITIASSSPRRALR